MQVSVTDLCKVFRGVTVLDNVNLTFECGQIYGIIGKNGSGKTMLLRAIAGLIMPTKGKISVDGQQLHKDISFPPNMGVLIEKPEMLGHLSGKKNLQLLADIRSIATDADIDALMREFSLDPDSKKPMRKYSQGMKQKVAIIQAIMEDQDLLILDEPFNALDEKTVVMLHQKFLKFKTDGKLIIITSHHKDDIEALCDHTFVIEDGRIRE